CANGAPLMRFAALVLASVLLLAACAAEHLAAAAPADVSLTGEWNFNPNLSDDPDKLGDPDRAPQRLPGSHRGHNGRGGGGMVPMGSLEAPGYSYLRVASPPRRFPKAPQHLSITQNAGKVVI